MPLFYDHQQWIRWTAEHRFSISVTECHHDPVQLVPWDLDQENLRIRSLCNGATPSFFLTFVQFKSIAPQDVDERERLGRGQSCQLIDAKREGYYFYPSKGRSIDHCETSPRVEGEKNSNRTTTQQQPRSTDLFFLCGWVYQNDHNPDEFNWLLLASKCRCFNDLDLYCSAASNVKERTHQHQSTPLVMNHFYSLLWLRQRMNYGPMSKQDVGSVNRTYSLTFCSVMWSVHFDKPRWCTNYDALAQSKLIPVLIVLSNVSKSYCSRFAKPIIKERKLHAKERHLWWWV